MQDLISRQAAIDLLKQMRKDGDMIPWEGKDVFARIRKLSSAQPERKGRWLHTRVNSEPSVTGYFLLNSCECSECGVICEQESNFCPNCGADMRRAKFDGEKGQS